MVEELKLVAPSFNLFFWFNAIGAAIALSLCIKYFYRNNQILIRPAFSLAALLCIFYQVPLVLFADEVQKSLADHWTYAVYVNITVITLLLLSKVGNNVVETSTNALDLNRLKVLYYPTAIFCVVSVGIYFSNIPFDCTALYALIFDPRLTSLAREFSAKLASSGYSSIAFGAYANAFAPIFVLISILISIKLSQRSKFFYSALIVFISLSAVAATLSSGTKGLILPIAIMVAVASYYMYNSWRARAVLLSFSCMLFVFLLIAFEQLKERSSTVGAYDFAACSVTVGTCNQSQELINSMAARDYSLSLPKDLVAPIAIRLENLCSTDSATQETAPQAQSTSSFLSEPLALTTHTVPVEQPYAFASPAKTTTQPARIEVKGATDGSTLTVFSRTGTFFRAMLNRVFVVPFQVSVWHFMYAETEAPTGIKTLPFANRFLGKSLNMPELVYQKYGVIYSKGDRTSTSTAPTSFLLAYPAYLGALGLIIALFCAASLDIAVLIFSKLIDKSLLPLLAGLTLIMSINLMTSDFVTVLISHGGLPGLLLLAILALLIRLAPKNNSTDKTESKNC